MFDFTLVYMVVAVSLVSAVVGAMLLGPYNNAGSGAVLGLLVGPFGAVIAALMAVTEELKKQSGLALRLAAEAAAKETDATKTTDRAGKDRGRPSSKTSVSTKPASDDVSEERTNWKDEARARQAASAGVRRGLPGTASASEESKTPAAKETDATEEKLGEAQWSAASMRDRKLAAAAES